MPHEALNDARRRTLPVKLGGELATQGVEVEHPAGGVLERGSRQDHRLRLDHPPRQGDLAPSRSLNRLPLMAPLGWVAPYGSLMAHGVGGPLWLSPLWLIMAHAVALAEILLTEPDQHPHGVPATAAPKSGSGLTQKRPPKFSGTENKLGVIAAP
jgi:hypothetical protein